HTPLEQQRLIKQARFLAPATEHFLDDAGVGSGMRVLDIGCGMGDVSMLLARRVGPQGRVVSIDLDQASIATAQQRVRAAGFANMHFHHADIATFRDAEPFDAIVGRLVLEFVPDPIASICRLSHLLRPDGVMALQEPSWKVWLAYTAHLPLRMAVTTLLRDTFVAGGVNTEMELPLYRGFMAAGLKPPQLRLELPVGDAPEFRGLLHDLLLAVWPRASSYGLPLASLGDPATLAARLDAELNAHQAFASFVALIGAFARKPRG
ncbi:MAG: class I SAM-dependent methyltransferase, partial [Hyphomicrobiaceae bacterium]|nr:class I SAM-dependent methyltransferase [Hyphomicrobiaceae bacterium]